MKSKVSQAIRMKVNSILMGITLLLVTVAITSSHSRSIEGSRPLTYYLRPTSIKDSLDKKTGLVMAPGFAVVSTTCVRCHSPNLITQKRATREGWIATIRWMQQTQGLWDLGPEEPIVLDYLAKNYAPKNEGRRPLLKNTEWYKLNN